MQEEFFLYRLQFLFELSQLFIFFLVASENIFFASSNDFLFLGGIGMENWSWSSRKILFWMMIMMLTGKNYHPLEQFLEWTFLEDVGRFERFPPNITCFYTFGLIPGPQNWYSGGRYIRHNRMIQKTKNPTIPTHITKWKLVHPPVSFSSPSEVLHKE